MPGVRRLAKIQLSDEATHGVAVAATTICGILVGG